MPSLKLSPAGSLFLFIAAAGGCAEERPPFANTGDRDPGTDERPSMEDASAPMDDDDDDDDDGDDGPSSVEPARLKPDQIYAMGAARSDFSFFLQLGPDEVTIDRRQIQGAMRDPEFPVIHPISGHLIYSLAHYGSTPDRVLRALYRFAPDPLEESEAVFEPQEEHYFSDPRIELPCEMGYPESSVFPRFLLHADSGEPVVYCEDGGAYTELDGRELEVPEGYSLRSIGYDGYMLAQAGNPYETSRKVPSSSRPTASWPLWSGRKVTWRGLKSRRCARPRPASGSHRSIVAVADQVPSSSHRSYGTSTSTE